MKIQKFSQIGKRGNNEDSLGLSPGLITVCDGMGGHVSGERASGFVVDALMKAFPKPAAIGKMEIQQQLNQIQTDLNGLLEKEPELEKMGTTFTGVFITPDVWYAAHIGDSRIYLFRPSEKKLWHTWDHSLVGELMRTHEITLEAGRFHPMSNRISKAIIAQKDGKPANASIVKIDQLKAGDIFMLCSDGVVEAWGDHELVRLFADPSLDFDQKCEKLRQQCEAKSKDNNTAIIAEVEAGDAFEYGTDDELEWTTFADIEANYQQYLKDNPEEEPAKKETENQEIAKQQPEDMEPVAGTPFTPKKPRKKRLFLWMGIILALIAALVVAILLFSGKSKESEKAPVEQAPVEQAPVEQNDNPPQKKVDTFAIDHNLIRLIKNSSVSQDPR